MTRRSKLLAAGATFALALVAGHSASQAAVMSVLQPAQLSATPITFALGTATFSFTLDASGFFPMSDVSTGGSGMVSTIFGGVADFGAGSVIYNDPSNLLYTFASYASPTSIPNSAADDFIGLAYADATGATHYGYAEVFGSTFVGYAYQTTANTAITTAPVPEPASIALLVGGLAVAGLARGRRRSGRQEASA